MKKIKAFQIVLCHLCLYIVMACSDDAGEENSQLNASAGNDMNVLVGEAVQLNGSGSSDLKGNPFEFSWKFISKPATSDATLNNSGDEKPSFTPDVYGKYKVQLTISNTSQDRDTITVSAFDVITVDGNYENLFPGPDVGIRDFAAAMDQLYGTCAFTEIGGISAKKIARYNGTSWSAMGCGLEVGGIYDMIEFKGNLYVTGNFEEIGCIDANNIARWDGDNWHTVEGGLTGGSDPFGHALSIYKDELYVGGEFTKAGDVAVSNIAKWDGVSWSAVGIIEKGSVRELQVYKQKLYAGGFFTVVNGTNIRYIAAYNGNSWASLGSLEDLELKNTGIVAQMEVFDDLLFIAGGFTANNTDISELITWNGSAFNDFGRAFTLFLGNEINELKAINGILYIGGDFKNVVGSQANNILQWDGARWGIMGEGISGQVNSIELFNGKIYIGGDFTSAGGQDADDISIWTKN